MLGSANKRGIDELQDGELAKCMRDHLGTPAHILEKLLAARRVLFGPRRQVQQRLFAVRQNTPGSQDRLARLPQMQPLGNAIDKQVDDLEFR